MTGLTTLGNASTTQLSVSSNAYLATTTIASDGTGVFLVEKSDGTDVFKVDTVTPSIIGIGKGATYVICASDAINKKGCDYIADGTNDEVEIQAALDTLYYTSGLGLHVKLSEGEFNICDPLLIEGHEWLQGSGWGATTIKVCDTWTVSQTSTNTNISGTDIYVTVPTVASFQIGDYIWVSNLVTNSTLDDYLADNEYCIADISGSNLILGTPQNGWASCASVKLNASTFCGGGACTQGTITVQAKIGIIYDISLAAAKRNRAAIWYKEGSSTNDRLMISDIGFNGNLANVFAARGIDTGDGGYTNQVSTPVFKNLILQGFMGDGMRVDMLMDAVFDNINAGSNNGFGINIVRGGDYVVINTKAVETKKAGLAIGTKASATGGVITHSYFGSARSDTVEGIGLKLVSGGENSVIGNYITCANLDCTNGSYKQAYGIYNSALVNTFTNNILQGGTAGIYLPCVTGKNVITNNIFEPVAGINKAVVRECSDTSGQDIVENNINANDTCTTNCNLNTYQTSALSGVSSVISGTLKIGQYEGQRKKVYMSDATNPVWLYFNGNHYLGTTRIYCYFNAVNEYWEGVWQGTKWVDVAMTCDLGYRNNDTGQTLNPDVSFAFLHSAGQAVSGTLGNPTDPQISHGKLYTISMTNADNCGAGCAISITNCDQDAGDGDNACTVSLNATTDKCTFIWDGIAATPEWDLVANSGCTITD